MELRRQISLLTLEFYKAVLNLKRYVTTLGSRGNSLVKSGRPKAGETNVRSEVSETSEGPNASSLWWQTQRSRYDAHT